MKKYYIKKNIIGFIVGVILCTGTFVYAAVTFPSNEVSYDNTESGLSSTNVKGAIDELYTECTTVPAGDQIIENAGLEKDEYECRYFFTGANPNNYVTFNGETAGWRIISVGCDGTIKIIKNNSIGNMIWDSSKSNNWARPSTLNTYLNETYYSSLTNTAKQQIAQSNFSIGAIDVWDNISKNVNAENEQLWKGTLALPTATEYLRTNSSKDDRCRTITNFNISCTSTGWLDNNINWWTLSPHSDFSDTVFSVTSGGYIGNNYGLESTGVGVRPVLYLKSSIKITGGTGTSSDPYQISL